jgi:hypothetical protein
MSFTFTSYEALLFPLIILFGIFGWRKGFWREFGNTAGLAVAVLLTVIFPVQFLGFINRIIVNIPRVIGVLLGRETTEPLPGNLIFGDPTSGRFLFARVSLFILMAVLVYTMHLGWAYEGGKPRAAKTNGERVLGAVFGAITGFLWFVAVNDFLNTYRVVFNRPTLPLEGTTISTSPSDIDALLAFVPTLIVVLIIILVVLALVRLPRLWTDGGKR